MRQEEAVQGAQLVKQQDDVKNKRSKKKNFTLRVEKALNLGTKKDYPPCQHYGKKDRPPFKCWRRPDVKCSKCNQLGNEAVICKYKNQQQGDEKQVADQEEKISFLLQLVSLVTKQVKTGSLIVSTKSKKVRIGNDDHIVVKGKGTIAIISCSGTKFITDVLYVPNIDQNLLSVGQFVEKGFKVKFMEKACVIEDA
ncbi:Retrovirus-related Pol polyprotein from transposon TNT 1-94 [Gossypium australe]|uniref:Retrovirus-related Pol polyprotein from transposon TNT 1-94 n=1 Tax=Gossypium australe TaxID=47621 RepID=A0A5B6W7J2_9ROSI|nr:Retrovirus-related Pol polyprotein from transposon TNT 1-94 [Gossypium australe]